ncbi:MAG TPA: ABC transporter permease, partial [Bryobacteraceae bacterium]
MMRWIAKLRNTLFTRSLDADLADEVRDHIERRAADLVQQGVNPSEARRQAELWFGNTTALREQSREIRMWGEVDKTWQDIRCGLRGLIRNPALTLTGIVSLTLAIGANTAIFSLVDTAFLRPLPVPDAQSLVTLGPATAVFSYPQFRDLRDAAGDSARIALFTPPNRAEAQIDGPESPYEDATLQFVSPDAFDMLGLPAERGTLFNPQLDHYPAPRNVLALSDAYWTRRFGGDPSVIGRSLTLDGRTYTVIGVVHRGFTGVDAGRAIDIFLPISQFDPGVFTNPDAKLFRLMGRLAPGVTAAQLAARLQPTQRVTVQSGAQGISTFGRQYGRALLILSVVSACILLIACANLAGLLLARAASRSGEIALRVSLGARRGRLIRQFLTEGLLIVSPSALLGCVLAPAAAGALLSIISTPANPIALDLTPDVRALMFSAAVCALAVLIVGLAPALQATGAGP